MDAGSAEKAYSRNWFTPKAVLCEQSLRVRLFAPHLLNSNLVHAQCSAIVHAPSILLLSSALDLQLQPWRHVEFALVPSAHLARTPTPFCQPFLIVPLRSKGRRESGITHLDDVDIIETEALSSSLRLASVIFSV